MGVVFPGVERFIDDYLSSLESQTYTEFDLLLANDGVDGLDVILKGRQLNWFCGLVNGSIASNRRMLIHKALDMNYQKIIFTDTDDTFEVNRIELASTLLDRHPVVVNDLDITDIQGNESQNRYFLKRFYEKEMITKNTILSGNLMGLSNTAVRKDVLLNCPALAMGDPIAFDWYLWAFVLHDGNKACFTSETSTKYRVYLSNTAGLPQELSENNIIKGVEVKRQHYALLASLSNEYLKLANGFTGVTEKLPNETWRNEYTVALRESAIDSHMWWENIRMPSEVGLL